MHHPTRHPRAAHRQMIVSRRQAALSPLADVPQCRFALLLPHTGHPSREDADPAMRGKQHSGKGRGRLPLRTPTSPSRCPDHACSGNGLRLRQRPWTRGLQEGFLSGKEMLIAASGGL